MTDHTLNAIFEPVSLLHYSKIEDSNMERINVHAFFSIGAEFSVLNDIIEGNPISYPLIKEPANIIQVMSRLKNIINEEENKRVLKVTREEAEKLLKALEELYPSDPNKDFDANAIITKKQADKIRARTGMFNAAFGTEMNNTHHYYIPQKGIYSVDTLIEHGEEIFDEDTLSILSADIKRDLRSAGRCFVFELPTAFGFHLFRAVETVLKDYYLFFMQSTTLPNNNNWGLMHKRMTDSTLSPKADQRVLGELERIKDNYRNPYIHPELTLELHEANVVLSAIQSFIQMMVADMEKNKDPNSPLAKLLP